jgi:TnpA family transposase
MPIRDKNLSILTDTEKQALYDLPDFDQFQRAEYFSMTAEELTLALRRDGLPAQLLCLLQLGYFKAKQAFFTFTFKDVPKEDTDFLMGRYFSGKLFQPRPMRQKEYFVQRKGIAQHFGYRPWSEDSKPQLADKAAQLALRDVTPAFIVTELLAFLKHEKRIRPGYTTLQAIISKALLVERQRLGDLTESTIGEEVKVALQQLLIREDGLLELAAIKQDAKNFRYRMMVLERQKRATLAPLYRMAKTLLPSLKISQQNLNYYASLAHYYTIYDLRRMSPGQSYLYLLCYVWQRYRQLSDNLVQAFGYHMKQVEEVTKVNAKQRSVEIMAERNQATPQVGRLLRLYVDDTVPDTTPFGVVRQEAFIIMPKDTLLLVSKRLAEKPVTKMDLRWQAVGQQTRKIKKELRHLVLALEFSSTAQDSPWIAALLWMKTVFARQQRLGQRPLDEIPEYSVPKRIRQYLMVFNTDGKVTGLHGDRYEFWIYRQVRKRLDTGELYLDDSFQYRRFSDELVALDRQAAVLKELDIAWLSQPVATALDASLTELQSQWSLFDRELRQGKLKHLDYDPERKKLVWHRPKAKKDDALQNDFYAKLPARDIADIFRFVNGRCNFLTELTPLQPRYAKKIADDDSLMAVIMAQAMNHGNLSMAETSDIPYHVLEIVHQQCLRLATLKATNDRISNFIAELSIFPHYSFDLEVLYGSVDGQKFELATSNIKARHSRKYFGRGIGVSAYTLLANHVPLETALIGAHEHESYYVFDICYHNTSIIQPTMITGDMHIINRANFAILNWFDRNLAARFTNLQTQLKHLYGRDDPTAYSDFLIQPAGQIDRQLIIDEKSNIDRIIATLALKEMSQATLVRKLCTLSGHHRTRKAVFEYDKLIRSIYTLNYLRDPQLQRNVHRSQNRIESYHQLRSVITQVSGKKQLIGHTDLDIAISNQCGRLLANVVIAYNSVLLSTLLDRYQAEGNTKALAMLKKISPVAWQHIHFLGHYAFRDKHNLLDLDAILANVCLL